MKEKERWGLCMHAQHPLAKKESIERKDLFGIPLITTGRTDPNASKTAPLPAGRYSQKAAAS